MCLRCLRCPAGTCRHPTLLKLTLRARLCDSTRTVIPQSGVSASAPVRAAARAGDDTSTVRLPIDIRRFPWIRRLAADYAFDYASVAEFFAGNPADPAAWRDAIARTQQHPRQREAVARILEAQQRQRGAPPEALTPLPRCSAIRAPSPSSPASRRGSSAVRSSRCSRRSRPSGWRNASGPNTAFPRSRSSGSTPRITTGTRSRRVASSTPDLASCQRVARRPARGRIRPLSRASGWTTRPPAPSPNSTRSLQPTEFSAVPDRIASSGLSARAPGWPTRSAAGSNRRSARAAWSCSTPPTRRPSRWSPTCSRARSSTPATTSRLAAAAGDALQARGYHAQAIAARGQPWRSFT